MRDAYTITRRFGVTLRKACAYGNRFWLIDRRANNADFILKVSRPEKWTMEFDLNRFLPWGDLDGDIAKSQK